METFVSFTKEKLFIWDLHNMNDTCALLYGNFFGIRLNIASSLVLHSGDHTAKYLFFTCSQFCEELKYATQALSSMQT